MFRTNILGYKKKDVDEFVKFSLDSVVKLRRDILSLKIECANKSKENEELREELKETSEKLKKMGLINARLVKLKNEQRLKWELEEKDTD